MCPVLPSNWPAAKLFSACLAQWRRGPDGRLEGLDYAACRAAAKGMGIGWRREFGRLRVMERAVLEALSGPPEAGA